MSTRRPTWDGGSKSGPTGSRRSISGRRLRSSGRTEERIMNARRTTLSTVAVIVVGCVIAAAAVVRAQRSGAAQTPALTPQDYIDIQQLVSNYPYGLDGNTDNGATYASLFAPGAVFGRPRTEGRENLMALANTQPRGAN